MVVSGAAINDNFCAAFTCTLVCRNSQKINLLNNCSLSIIYYECKLFCLNSIAKMAKMGSRRGRGRQARSTGAAQPDDVERVVAAHAYAEFDCC